MKEHPSEETIQLHLDDELSGSERMTVQGHLVECEACREAAAKYESLRDEIAALPMAIQPRADLWPGIAERIGAVSPQVRPIARRGWPVWGTAAGAAIVAIAAALLLGIALGRQMPRPELPAVSAEAPAGEPGGLLASYEATDYEAAIADLEGILEAMRGELQPETVSAVEANLAIIDAAIEDSRQALLADPANEHLHRHLVNNMQMKLGLLRMVAGAATTTEI